MAKIFDPPERWYRVRSGERSIDSYMVVLEAPVQIGFRRTKDGITYIQMEAKHSHSDGGSCDWYPTRAEAVVRQREHAQKQLKEARDAMERAMKRLIKLAQIEAEESATIDSVRKDGQERDEKKLRYLSNTFNPSRPDAQRGCLHWLADKVIGEPGPSEMYTVEQMKEMGMVGVYVIEPQPNSPQNGNPADAVQEPGEGLNPDGIQADIGAQAEREAADGGRPVEPDGESPEVGPRA